MTDVTWNSDITLKLMRRMPSVDHGELKSTLHDAIAKQLRPDDATFKLVSRVNDSLFAEE